MASEDSRLCSSELVSSGFMAVMALPSLVLETHVCFSLIYIRPVEPIKMELSLRQARFHQDSLNGVALNSG